MWNRRDKQKKEIKETPAKSKIHIGDVVLYKNRKDKLDPKWYGPFIVQLAKPCGGIIITDSNRTKDIIINETDVKKIIRGCEIKKIHFPAWRNNNTPWKEFQQKQFNSTNRGSKYKQYPWNWNSKNTWTFKKSTNNIQWQYTFTW